MYHVRDEPIKATTVRLNPRAVNDLNQIIVSIWEKTGRLEKKSNIINMLIELYGKDLIETYDKE